jgi:RNA polymerase sigma-70 factor (ECF subfamily)
MDSSPLDHPYTSFPAEAQARLVAAARSGDQAAFASLTEPHRKELLSHCYRMLGSLEDAEDQVQETLLRAWRRLDTYQGAGTLRAWLYKIASNVCLDLLRRRPRRSLPLELCAPADPTAPLEPPITDPVWIEPFPDEQLAPQEAGPEARYEARESISFAFMIALQELPPRQRCALILGDVLEWQAAEVAGALEVSVSAVNSLLHRARLTLKQRYHQKREPKPVPIEARQAQLLERYLRAWESADIDGIVALLTEDATFPMPPLPGWYRGKAAIRSFILATSLAGEAAGRWKLLPIRANGSPGFAFYVRDEARGRYLPFALQVLRFEGELFGDVTTFGYPVLFPAFNLPAELKLTSNPSP